MSCDKILSQAHLHKPHNGVDPGEKWMILSEYMQIFPLVSSPIPKMLLYAGKCEKGIEGCYVRKM